MPGPAYELLNDTRELLHSEEWVKLMTLVSALHPSDIGELVMLLEEDERAQLVRRLPPEDLGQILEFAGADKLPAIVEAVGVEDLPPVLDEVDSRVAADVLQLLPPEERTDTLEQLEHQTEVGELLEYAEGTAGRIMSHGYVALEGHMTVQQAIEYLRMWKPPSERAYYLYVTDSDQKLLGVVSIRDLLVAPGGTLLEEITDRDVHAITAETDQEEAARTLQKYDLLAIPVVDEEGRLAGVTSADELMDVLSEEATEDMYRMVGLDEAESPFLPISRTIRLRLPWLVVNVFAASVGGFVVSLFDGTLQRAVVLAAFLPIVANQSGVTGTQAMTVTVRTMALRGTAGGLKTTLPRELLVGLANGFVVGLVLALIAFVLIGNGTLALVLLGTMTLASAVATLAGQLIPVSLRALGADPALASSIFVTMVTDALSFLLLLGLAAAVIDQLS